MDSKIEEALIRLAGNAPKIWRSGDKITELDLTRLASFPTNKVMDLFEGSSTEASSNYTYEFTCDNCEKDSVFYCCSKSLIGKILQNIKSDIPVICNACSEEQKRRTQESRAQESELWKNQQRQRCEQTTEIFIQSYLDPSKAWKEGISKKHWFYEIVDFARAADWAVVENFMKKMPYGDFLKTPYWKAVAQQVKYNAGFRCQMCNSTEFIQAHHRDYAIHGTEHRNLQELTCLCNTCHGRHHGKENV